MLVCNASLLGLLKLVVILALGVIAQTANVLIFKLKTCDPIKTPEIA
jgi:hypothetical protein